MIHPMLLLSSDESYSSRTLLFVVKRTLVNQSHLRTYSTAQLSLANYLTNKWLDRYQRWLLFLTVHILLHPTSARRLTWDVISVLVCLYEAVMNPLYFLELVGDSTNIDTFACCFWTLDIFLSLITGYFTKSGLVELSPRKIVLRYARTWMTLDLLIVTIDWSVLIADASGLEMVRIVKIVARIGRVVRLLRFLKLFPKLANQMGRINSEMVLTLSRIAGLIVAIVFLNHYVACFFFGAWTDLHPDNGDLWRYTTALHWAMMQSALGSMDIHPETPFQRVFSVITLIIAFVMFSTLLSSITDAAAHIRSLHASRLRQEREVRRFFAENRITKRLACRVWHYITHHDLQVNRRPRCQDVELFQLLPAALNEDIMCEAFTPALVVYPLFSLYGVIEPEAMQLIVCACCQNAIMPKQRIECRKAAGAERYFPDDMIFVTSQTLEYWPHGDAMDTITIEAGKWLCEESLWARSPLLLGPLVAEARGCDLIMVPSSRFREVARQYPNTILLIREYARRFISDFNVASSDIHCKNILFNDPEEVLDRVVRACACGATVDIPSPALSWWVQLHVHKLPPTELSRKSMSSEWSAQPSKSSWNPIASILTLNPSQS